MNPFLQSPVAQALPESRRARYWREAVRPPCEPLGPPMKPRARWSRLPRPMALGGAAFLGALLPSIAFAVNVNQATAQELEAVRGIGAKTAQLIIQERQRGGDFESFSDLSDRVRGIGPKKAAALQAAGLGLAPSAPAAQATGATNPPPAAAGPGKSLFGLR